MKTRIPKQLDAPVVKVRQDDRVRQVRRYKLITPLFGGGVEPHWADPITIVRGTEVRGHLRFWWRATRGGQFDGSLERMRRREEEIWGSAAAKDKPGPSAVSVYVCCQAKGTPDRPFEVTSNKRGGPTIQSRKGSVVPAYAAFPLQPKREEAKIGMETDAVRVGVEFTLELGYPQHLEQEIEATLWAWETFGGLGARTRRGFGALQLVSIDSKPMDLPAISQAQAWISDGLQKHVVLGRWPESVSHLTQNAAFVPISRSDKADPIKVWRYLVDKLKAFRQARHPDKNNRPYGRSKWPEPDQVRRLTGTHALKHVPRHPVRKFPRGQFGLPIIFHFKDEKQGDPSDSSLQGSNNDRFASALILRPLVCINGAVGLALRLASPESPPDGYILKSADKTYSVQVQGLSKSEADQIKPLDGDPDVLQAFLDFLRS